MLIDQVLGSLLVIKIHERLLFYRTDREIVEHGWEQVPGDDHRFISKEYISIGKRPYGETESKTTRVYAQSGQYHTIMYSSGS